MSQDLAAIEFARNPDPRCPLVLVLDTSGSMSGTPISQLNEGLNTLKEELMEDALAQRRVEVALVTFGDGGVQLLQDFVTVAEWEPQYLSAGGMTPMGEALNLGLDTLSSRKASYRANGVQYYRPWIFMITDGSPTDDISRAGERVRAEEAQNGAAFFAVLVEGADADAISALSSRTPLRLRGLAFRELFQWLSASQRRVSASQVGDQVALPPVDWSVV